MLVVDGVKYRIWIPKKEEELLDMVKENSKDIFGEDSIYFDIKHKLISKAGIGSIPDGYVITLSDPPQWYIVEVELSSHPLYEHIVVQLIKFINGLNNYSSRMEIVDALHSEINADIITKAVIQKSIGSGEVYHFLTKLIASPPTLAIVIEEKTKKLEEACMSLPPVERKIVEFKVFERVDAGIKNAYLFEPLYEEKKEGAPPTAPIPKKAPTPTTVPGQKVELVLGKMHTPRVYCLIPLYRKMNIRRFFPGYKIPFILETDIGDIGVRVTSGRKGDQVGDPDAGKYIQGKGLCDWYNRHKELDTGDSLVIEKTDKKNRYKLSIKKQ